MGPSNRQKQRFIERSEGEGRRVSDDATRNKVYELGRVGGKSWKWYGGSGIGIGIGIGIGSSIGFGSGREGGQGGKGRRVEVEWVRGSWHGRVGMNTKEGREGGGVPYWGVRVGVSVSVVWVQTWVQTWVYG